MKIFKCDRCGKIVENCDEMIRNEIISHTYIHSECIMKFKETGKDLCRKCYDEMQEFLNKE